MSVQPSAAAAAAAREVFGLPGLRPGQAEVIAAGEAGRDILFVAPTGAGKSLAYWIPTVAGGGLALVVSPLIALMTDQVERLRRSGVAAAAIHSQLESVTQRAALDAARRGGLRFLYVAPERFAAASFMSALAEMRVSRFIVDEAHCISSWGHDFRPDYRRLAAAVDAAGRPPVTAVTATATPRVRDDIGENLKLRDPLVVVTGFIRTELSLEVRRCRGEAEKTAAVLDALAERPGRAIVYCGRTRDCDETALRLSGAGIAAAAYHGGLDGAARQRVQAAFSEARLRVIVATSAFGMGVDIADIRQVIHRDFPGSLEAYYQEAGRAGRDGEPSRCLLLYTPADRDLQAFFIEQAFPERDVIREVYRALLRAGRWDLDDWAERLPGLDRHQVKAAFAVLEGAGALLADGEIRRLFGPPIDFAEQARLKENAYAKVHQMMAYATSRDCRHARIADYFGEAGAPRTCAACDNCLSPRQAAVAVPEAAVRAVLEAVARFDGHLGAARIAALLRGAHDAWTRERPWARDLPFSGLLSTWEDSRVRELIGELLEQDCLRRGHSERPTLSLSPRGRAVLRGAEQVTATLGASYLPAVRGARAGASGQPAAELDGAAQARFDRLRRWRRELSLAEERPAFTIFDDRTLRELATANPTTAVALLGIRGVGPGKAGRYGDAVLAVLGET